LSNAPPTLDRWRITLSYDYLGTLHIVGMFTVNRLTENFRLTGFSINRTETGNMATTVSAKIFFNFCVVKSKYTIYRSSLIWDNK